MSNLYEKFWIEDDILHGEFTKGLVMDLQIAKVCLEDRLNMAQGKLYPFLLDATGIHHMTKEARDYLGSLEGSEGIIASAIIIGSPVTKIIWKFLYETQ